MKNIITRFIFSVFTLIIFSNISNAQQTIFWRDNAANGNWENGGCGSIGTPPSQWWYPGFAPNQARNRPDCNDGSTTRHNLNIDNNHELTMTTNTAFWGIRSLTFVNTATGNRIINSSPDDNTRGIGLSNGIFHNGNSGVTHTFNTRIGIDAATITLSTATAGATTIYNREIFGNANNTIFDGAGATTVSAVFSGTGASVTKNGSGTLTFSGTANNTYTGTTTLNGGTFVLNKSANIIAIPAAFTANTGTTIRTDAANQWGTGTPPLVTLNGTAILNLNNNNQRIALASASSTSSVTLGTATLDINNTGTDTYAGVISGTGGVTKTNTGTQVLSGANTYTGTTTVTAGILRLGAANVIADASNVTLNGGTLSTGATTGNSETVGTLNLNATSTIAFGTGAHTLTFANSSAVSWAGGFMFVTGWAGAFNGTAGTAGRLFIGNSAAGITMDQRVKILFLNGSNYHTATILSSGEVVPTANVAMFWNGTGTWSTANTWSLTPGGPYNQTWVSGRAAYFSVASSTITGFTTNVSEIVAFQDVTLSAVGTMGFGPSGGGIAPVYVASGRTFSSGQAFSTAAGTGLIKNGGGNFISGNGNLAGIPAGITLNQGLIAWTGLNGFGSGTLTINGGVLSADGSARSPNISSIIVNSDFQFGDAVNYAAGSGNLTFAATVNLGSSATRTITLGRASTYALNGVISGTGSNLVLAATAAGTLSLGGANTYGGNTTINGGTLLLTTGADRLPTTTGLTLANTSGAVLNLNNFAQTVASLSGGGASGGNITTGGTSGILTVNQSGITTYAGVISGTGGLTKSGSGTLTLSGANTYTGATTITAGTVQLGAAGVLANTSNMVLNGGIFRTGATTGFAETLGTLNLTANSSIDLGTGAHDINFANSSSVSWTGATSLTINGWAGTGGSSGTAGRIFFGSGTGTLTPAQLSQISFTGYPGTPILLGTGELVPPVPPITFTWNGSISNDWSTGANWTPSSGPIVAPSATDLVVIPNVGSYTNELIISTSVACLDFTVNANGKYTLAAGGTLTVNGVYTYSSSTAATFACSSTLNINGTGVSTIPAHSYGNLNLVGGNRILASSGTIGICGNYTPSAGTTTVTGSTVNFNGTTAQSILTNAAVFNNLTISNTSASVSSGVNVTVNGTGNINASAVFVQTAGTFAASAAATTVNGILRTTGTGAVTGSAANLIFSSTGQYNHNRDGGVFPTATWNTGSLVNLNGLVSTAPTGLGQTFSDFTYNCTGQTGTINLGLTASFSCRDFSFQSSGSGPSITSLITGTAATFTINRDMFVSGGSLVGTNGTGTLTLNINRNFEISNGTFNFSSNGNCNINHLNDFTQSGGTFTRTAGTATWSFAKVGLPLAYAVQNISQTGGTMSGTFTFRAGAIASNYSLPTLITDLNIGANATFTNLSGNGIDFGTFVLTGSTFNAINGATLFTANPNGFVSAPTASGSVQTSARTIGTSVNYVFNGATPQVTGSLTSATVTFLTLANTTGVTLTNNTAINTGGQLSFATAGLFSLGSSNLTFNGTATTFGVASDRYIRTNGAGRCIRTVSSSPILFPIGNSAYNPITLTNTGTSDAFGIRVIDAITTPTQNDGTKLVNRYWEVNEAVAGGTTLTAAAQYNSGEENVNFAAGVQLKTGLHNGTTWTTQNATSSGSGPFVVTNSSTFGVAVATYTLGVGKDDGFLSPSVIYTWLGTNVGGDWGDNANWSPTGVPGVLDDVIINGTGTYTHELDITGSRNVTNFTVTANGKFNMSASSSLTISGDLTYTTSASATFDCSSTFSLSSASSQTIPALNYGNLNGTGGPRVLASSGTIGICGTFTPGAGGYTITGSTVNFNGTGAQTVNAFSYNNLSISGARTTNNVTLAAATINVAGTFNPTATFTTGNYINTGNTFNYNGADGQTIAAFNYNNLSSTNNTRILQNTGTVGIAGTFTTGTGAYTSTGSTVSFNGSGAQTIPVLPSTNYNNLIIAGSSTKSINATQTINGNMTVNSGTFVQSTSTAYNFTISGTLTINGGIYQQTNTVNNTLNVSGLVNIAGGEFYMARGTGSTASTVANFNNNFSVSSGGFDFNDNTGATSVGTINLAGSFTGTGGAVWCSGGTATTKGTFNFTSGSAATLNQGATSFDYINLVKSSGAGVLSLGSNIVIGDGQFRVATTTTVDAGLFTISISNTDASVSSEEFRLNTLANFITANAAGVSGTVSLSGSPSPAWQIAATSYITYSGTNQNTGMAATGQTSLARITWLGSGTLTPDVSLSISDQFNFTNNGLYLMGNFNLTLATAATLNGAPFSATKMFVTNGTGELLKSFTSTATFTWPIGENTGVTEYSPATLTVTTGVSGTVGLRVVNATHPNMAPATVYLNRYWRASTSLSSYSWTGNFTYTPADVVVGPETSLKLNVFNPNPPSSGWTEYASSSAASNVLTVTAGPGTGTLAGTDITGRVDIPLYYRSVSTGTWNNVSSWEASTDPLFLSPPPVTPVAPPNNANSAGIQIRNTHTITVGTTVWADDLTINNGGTLTVGAGGNFTLANGTAATDFTVNGNFNVDNTTTIQASSNTVVNGNWTSTVSPSSFGTISVNSTAVYNHAVDGGTVPTATWNSGSLLRITAMNTSSSIGGMTQTFHHIEYNCPSQTVASVQLSGAITAVNGNFTMISSGAGTRELRFFTNVPGSNINSSLTIAGNFDVQGGKVAVTNSSSTGTASPVLNITGNLTISGSAIFDMTGNSANTATSSTVNLSGDLTITGTGTIVRTQATPSTFRFNRSSGIQTYTAANPSSAVSANIIAWEVGNGTTQPELQIANDFVIAPSSIQFFTVRNNATLNCLNSNRVLATSSGNFTLQSGATLKTQHPDGITENVSVFTGSIQTNLTRVFNAAANYEYNGTVNQITGTGLPTSHTGTLTINNSGGYVQLTTSGSTGTNLVLQNGFFRIGSGNTYNLNSGGTVSGTGGDFDTGVNGGTLNLVGSATFSGNCNPYIVAANGGANFGSGTVTIQNGGTFRINAGGFVNTNAPFYNSNSTLEYNTGGNYDRGLEWSAASGRGYPGNVLMSTTTLNPARTGATYAAVPFNTQGNLTISSGANIFMDFGGNNMTVPLIVNGNLTLIGSLSGSASIGGDARVRGNWINNGAAVTNYFPNSRAVFFDGSTPQTIGGTNSTVNPFAFVIIDNVSDITLAAPQQINNDLTFTNGRLALSNHNLSMNPGSTISGVNSSRYIVTNGSGLLRRQVISGGGDVVFPVGTTANYAPATLNQSGAGTDILGVGVSAAPPFTNSVNDNNQMVNLEYTINEDVAGGNNLSTRFQWVGANEASAFDRTSTVYHGDWTGTAYQIRAAGATGGANPYFSTAVGYIGNLSNRKFVIGNINGILGCFQTIAAGDWHTPTTWNTGVVPPDDATACINHAITISTANTEDLTAVTINTGGSLNLGALYELRLVNGGSLTNSSGSVQNIGLGTVRMLGNGSIGGPNSITMNDLLIFGALNINTSPTINGTFQLNPLSFVNVNPPIYGPSSLLTYATAGSYNVSTEWTGNSTTAGLGVPNSVTILNGTTVNMPNSNRGIAGTMNINLGTLNLNATSGDLHIAGNWSRLATGTFNPNNRAVVFNGTSNQIINYASGTENFSYLIINKPSGNITLTSDIEVSANVGNILSVNRNIDLNGRTLFLNSTGGNIEIVNNNISISGATGSLISVSNGTKNIFSTGGGLVSFGANTLIALNSGLNFGSSVSTVFGTLQIALGGFVSVNPPTYEVNSTLRYFCGCAYGRGAEWSSTSGPGYPYHVRISPNGTPTTLDLSSGGSADRQIAGNLTIDDLGSLTMNTMTNTLTILGNVNIGSGASGSLVLSTNPGGDLIVGGDLTRNAGAVFTQNGRQVSMSGTVLQNINNISSFAFLRINNNGASVRINENTTVNNRLWLSNGTFNLNGFDLILNNGSQLRRSLGTATMSAPPTIGALDAVDMRYDATMTTGIEFINDLTKIRDLEITAGTLTLAGNRTVNRDVILSGGDLNLATFTLTHRGRVAAPSFSGSITVSGGGTRLITGAVGSRYDITGLGANVPNDYTKTVSTFGGTLLNFDSNVLVRIGDGSVDFGAGNPTTINGTLQVLLGGSVGQILNPCFYGVNSILRFANTVDYIVGLNDKTWAAGSISSGLPGIPWNVEILDAGTDLQLQNDRSLRGNLTITNGTFSLLYAGSGSFSLGGNWSRTGATSGFVNPTNKKIVFNRQSAGNQTITTGGGVSFETFYDLEIAPVLGDVIATSGTAIQVNNELLFTAGKFILNGTNTITLGTASSNGIITGANSSRYLVTYTGGLTSTLVRHTNTNTTYLYPVGDITNYTPITLTLYSGGNSAATISGSVTATAHPQIGTSTNYLSRYWSMDQTGLTSGFGFGVQFLYADGDIVGSESALYPFKWTPNGSTPGTGWIGAGGSGASFTMGVGTVNILTNTMNWDGIYSFSDITGNGNGNPLPVTLVDFRAQKVGKSVELNWKTLSEVNNDYFTVERTIDGINFIDIDKVDGAGSHNGELNYRTFDHTPYNGINYYRLKQTDFDGKFEYSKLVSVQYDEESGIVMSMFPNPSSGEDLKVTVNGTKEGMPLQISVFDAAGKLINTLNESASNGATSIYGVGKGLSNGAYYILLNCNGVQFKQKLMITNHQ